LARAGLGDPDPMVRVGALEMLDNLPGAQIWPLASPLLSDSNRGVRIRAAALLAVVPTANQPPADRERFERAAGEFVAAQRLNADRPEARAALANFYARRGLPADAEPEYKAALHLSAQYAPAAINLADLYRQLGRDGAHQRRRSLPAARPRRRRRRRVARGGRRLAAGCGTASCAGPHAHPPEAAGRGARRVPARRRARSRAGEICLCVCGRAAFGRT